MFTNSQVIIVLLIILILLQLYQLFYKNGPNEGFMNADDYKRVNYNTPYMKCDGNTGMLNNTCTVKSTLPKVKTICNKNLTLTDGPNYNTPAGEEVQPDIKGNIPKFNLVPTIKNSTNKISKPEMDNNSLLKLLNEQEGNESMMEENEAKSVANLEN